MKDLTVYSLPLTLIVAVEAAQELLHLLPAGLGGLNRSARRWWSSASYRLSGPSPTRVCSSALPHSRAGRTRAGWAVSWRIPHSRLVAQLLALAVLAGNARAAAALSTITGVLVVLNLIPAGFVFLEIRGVPGVYSDRQIYRALAVTLVGGTLVPVVLLLAGYDAPLRLAAVALTVLGGFAVRSLFLKIPHASHESRSRAGA